MSNLQITLFDSLYDVAVKPENQKTLSWEQLIKNLTKPRIATRKEDVKMFTAAKFKDGSKRCSDNVEAYHALVLDYDEGVHPLYFAEEYGEYEFCLYSSWNHRFDKANNAVDMDILKFRVVLPLKAPVSAEEYKQAIPVLKKMFTDADPAGFSPSQAFFLPSCPRERKEHFFAKHNEGEPFDFDALRLKIFVEQTKRDLAAMRKPKQQTDATLDEAQALLSNTSADCPYDVWVKIGMALKNLFDEPAFDVWQEWSETGASYDLNESKMRNKWRSFRTDGSWSYGYLVNRSREFPV